MHSNHFTPALGRPGLTRAYDLAIRLLTRETVWRSELLRQVAPHNNETIIDVGCGTGTFALMLKRAAPGARITAIDPDPHVLALARKKAEAAGIEIAWRQGFARDVAGRAWSSIRCRSRANERVWRRCSLASGRVAKSTSRITLTKAAR